MSNLFDNYTFRASQAGKIISKSGKLTQIIETHLTELFIEKIYGVRKEITSKYFEKGVINEMDGVDLLNKALHPGLFLSKNHNRFHNEYISGEIDCETKDIIYDIKNAWDQFTFEEAELTWEYEWQLRCYMWLWNKEKARLFYCLTEMPDHLIENEAKRYWYREKLDIHNPEGLEMEDVYMAFRERYDYSHLEPEERFKVWEIRHDEAKIDEMKDAVVRAREYLNTLDDERNERILRNKVMMGFKPDRKSLASKLQKIS